MLAAVSACGMALVHVSDGLKRDTEVCIAAIQSDPRAAAAVGSATREDPGVQAALQEAAERRARDEEEKAREEEEEDEGEVGLFPDPWGGALEQVGT